MKRKIRAFRCFLICVLLVPLLSGCWDRLDPENIAFVMAIGVDPGPRNDFLFTFALAGPKTTNGGIGGRSLNSSSDQNDSISVFTVEGSNIASAMTASQAFVARRLTFIHAKAFILGEDMARKGVIELMSEVVRNRQIRRTLDMITTRGSAQTYIRNIRPTTEQDINLWFELETDPNNMGAALPKKSRFHNFILDIESKGGGAVTILSAPRPDIRKGRSNLTYPREHASGDSRQLTIGDEYAGSIRRAGEVPVEFYGSAVYQGSKLAGFLNGSETKVLNMLRGQFLTTPWDFPDPADPQLNLTLNVSAQKQTRLEVQRNQDQIKATFHVSMEGDLMSVQTTANYTVPAETKKLERAIEQLMKQKSINLLQKTLHTWEVDCFYISNQLKSTFRTLQEWNDFDWKNHVKDTQFYVDISFKLRRHGDQVGPAIEGDQMK
ncbi:Ger(x)C family germination protein [Tumebacillus sp. BK434]|uniref:Ger(x)C family spore germination protein n=1 Tax=Tumebacillus sp. BK434 TaxID=2512169 RepID=UPI0010D66A2F|nr:Ger(x)C family spore germination C-terminal domain-containing protein [Tumebacillus sp. BK434]TCP53404.1 Ger(x)C family germination protein [Tumebacillus sp. BK434]